ncbi:MAG: hypothetical protein HFJ98_05660 [Eubacterium sp.]|nr:hypothetical protein [Eubacterium sp.]
MTNEELIQEIKSNKNVQSNMYLLYSQNMPLIKQWSKKYISKFGEEDILQECYIALYQAVQSFELKGYKFTSYLQKCIITHLSRQLSNFTGLKFGDDDKRLLMEYISLNNQQQQALIDISDIGLYSPHRVCLQTFRRYCTNISLRKYIHYSDISDTQKRKRNNYIKTLKK